MRNGQKRMRGRNNNHRKSQNPLTRVYESNGPDVKVRGTANHIAEKYIQLARDAQGSGDPVAAENYYQHAEHYFRLIAAAQEQFRQQNPYYNNQQQQSPGGTQQGADDGYDDDDEPSQSASGQSEPFSPREQPQPFIPRDAQPFPQRESQQQPNQPQHQGGRPHHQQPHHQQSQQPQPRTNDGHQDVGGLPSFITGGGAPQTATPNNTQTPGYGQNGHDQQDRNQQDRGQDRFGRHRRRRHRGPRPDIQDQPQQGATDGGNDDAPGQSGE